MKKKKIELNKKLVLAKDVIAALDDRLQSRIKGGLTDVNCQTAFNTCPYTLCAGCTQTQAPQTQPCGPFICGQTG